MHKLIIIDGHNLLFRMFYGIPRPVYNSEGQDIKAVLGFIGAISKLAKKLNADRLLVVFDSITSIGDRKAEYQEYKENRIDYSQVPDEENPFVQLPFIFKVLDYLNVAYLEVHGNEADDYIASVCHQYQSEYEITIVSTDSDFNQLVNDQVKIFNPRGRDGVFYTAEKVYEKFGIYPNQVVDYKSLTGDTSDNITGVKGIGPKRAVEILSIGTIDEILEGKTDLVEKYYSKIKDFETEVRRNQSLIQMILNLELNIDDDELTIKYDVNKSPMRILEECQVK